MSSCVHDFLSGLCLITVSEQWRNCFRRRQLFAFFSLSHRCASLRDLNTSLIDDLSKKKVAK